MKIFVFNYNKYVQSTIKLFRKLFLRRKRSMVRFFSEINFRNDKKQKKNGEIDGNNGRGCYKHTVNPHYFKIQKKFVSN